MPTVALLERDQPLARLEAALEAAAQGLGRIVSIEGEAGIGKTSILLAFAEAHRGSARMHMGGCEHLGTPEALGPLRDVARESHGRFAMSATSHLATFESLLRLLTDGRGPAVLMIEDLHWADDLTLDALRYLARRIRSERVLVVVTFRNDDGYGERLGGFWADMPRDGCERIELEPLSMAAVSTLARAAGRRGSEVFDATGGNPFHVTEYLAAEEDHVPRTVQEATLARAARLPPHGRLVLDCASIFPRRIDEALLQALARDPDHAGAEACLRAGMLVSRGRSLAFRHELARRAVHDAMSPLRQRELHAAALALLKARPEGRAAEAAHHAERARATEDVVAFSIQAADEAMALGAHREAVAHLGRALEHGTSLDDQERARLLEKRAEAGEQCGAFDVATGAIQAAIAAHRRIGDALGLGNALRIAARLLWLHGETELAERHADEALHVLRGHAHTWQYAMALSSQAQLDMLADRSAAAITRGEEAMALAERVGCSEVYIHALTNVSAARASRDTATGLPAIRAAIAEARRRGELDCLPRLYSNLTFMMVHDRRYEGLTEAVAEGVEAAVSRDNVPMDGYIRGCHALGLLDRGRVQEAMAEAESVVFGPYPRGTGRFPALVALSRARVRLGLPEGGVLDQARVLPTSHRDLMRLSPIAIADAEADWLGERRPGALSALREALRRAGAADGEAWVLAEAALWLTILGHPPGLTGEALERLSPPHRAHVEGRWREAAAAWAERGAPYEQAIALSCGDEAARREALAIFDRLGAQPAARRLRRIMRESGVRGVPAGPRSARRNDPAGLTPRQNEVLALLADGLSNGEIAERLSTSPKTVEHHVGAILAALDASSRLRAVQIARERGLFD